MVNLKIGMVLQKKLKNNVWDANVLKVRLCTLNVLENNFLKHFKTTNHFKMRILYLDSRTRVLTKYYLPKKLAIIIL